MVGDRVISPVYDDLPGVYLHAMAYDNLVTFNGDHKRADRDGLSLSTVLNGILLLFTVLVLLLVDRPSVRAMRWLGALTDASPRVKCTVVAVAILCVAVTVIIPTSLAAVFLIP